MHMPADEMLETAPPRVNTDPANEEFRSVPWAHLPAKALPLPGNGAMISESAQRIFTRMAAGNPPAFFSRGGAVVELDPAGGRGPVDHDQRSALQPLCERGDVI